MFLSLFVLYFFVKLVALPAFPRKTTRCVAPLRDEPGRIQGRKSSDYEPACSRQVVVPHRWPLTTHDLREDRWLRIFAFYLIENDRGYRPNDVVATGLS